MHRGQRRKRRSSSPAPNSKAKTDGEVQKSSKNQATKRKALQTKEAKVHTDSEFCEIPSCKFWHPPVCLNYRSEEKVVYMAITAVSDMLKQTERPTRSRRKVVRKDQQLH